MKTESLLTPLDPAPDASPATAFERTADLRLILATRDHETRQAPRRTRRLALSGLGAFAAAVVAVAVSAGVLGGPAAPVYASTPAPLTYSKPAGAKAAPAILADLAARVAQLPAGPPPNGYTHTVTSNWWLEATVGRPAESRIAPSKQEWWRRPDNSGRRVKQEPGQAPEVVEFPRGEFGSGWDTPAPTDQAKLTAWLQLNHPVENGPAETLVAITDLVREQVLEPQQRAALLRVLGTIPGLTYEGSATDRAGRTGEAFGLLSSMSGAPIRHLLIVDPQTGSVLAVEDVLVGKWNGSQLPKPQPTAGGKGKPAQQTFSAYDGLKIPSVIGYEMYLKVDRAAPPR